MTHKRALKKLMGLGVGRNAANKLLRKCTECGYSNAWVNLWQTNVQTLIRYAAENTENWCYFRQQVEKEG